MITTFFGAVACDVLLGLVCAAANFGKRKMNASATQNRFRVVERKAGDAALVDGGLSGRSFVRKRVGRESGAFVIMK